MADNKTYNEQHFQTNEDANAMESRIMKALEPIAKDASSALLGSMCLSLGFDARTVFSAANFLVQNGWRKDKTVALGRYYGSTQGYPRAILAYAESLRQ